MSTDAEAPSADPPGPRPVRGAATVFSDFAAMSGARLGSAVLALGAITITTRVLSPQSYGVYGYVTVVALLLFAVSAGWNHTAVRRYGRETLELEGSMRKLTWNRALIAGPLLVLAMAVTVVVKLLGGLPPEMTWTFVGLALLSALVLAASEHVFNLLETDGRIKVSAVRTLGQRIVTVLGLIALLLAGPDEPLVAVLVLSIAVPAVFAAAAVPLVWRSGIWPPQTDRLLRRRMLLLSTPLIAFAISQYVVRSVDLIVIRAFGTTEDVGLYAVAYQGYSVLLAFAMSLSPVLLPLFVSLTIADKSVHIRRYVDRVTPQLVLVAATLAAVAVSVVPAAVGIVFGPSFDRAGLPLALLFVALVIVFYASCLSPVVVLHERTRTAALVSVAAALLNVVGDLVLVGAFGLVLAGPAIATAVAAAVIAVGYLRVAREVTEASARPRVIVLVPVLAGLAAALLLPEMVAAAVGVPVALVLGVVIARTGRLFDAEDVALVDRLDVPSRLRPPLRRAVRFAAAGR